MNRRRAAKALTAGSLAICALAVLALSACSNAPKPPGAEDLARAAGDRPAVPRLAGLYVRSCHACHGQAGTNAPLARDRAQWDPRWKKGEAALLTSVITGYRGMPAGGQCVACTPDDDRALIRFMAGRD